MKPKPHSLLLLRRPRGPALRKASSPFPLPTGPASAGAALGLAQRVCLCGEPGPLCSFHKKVCRASREFSDDTDDALETTQPPTPWRVYLGFSLLVLSSSLSGGISKALAPPPLGEPSLHTLRCPRGAPPHPNTCPFQRRIQVDEMLSSSIDYP